MKVLFLAFLLLVSVSADKDDDNERSKVRNNKRELEVECRDYDLKIESKSIDKNSADRFKLQFQAQNRDFRIDTRYQRNDKVNNTKTDITMRVKFFKIIEYKETNGVEGYQPEEQVSNYSIGKNLKGGQKSWNKLGCPSKENTTGLNEFVASTVDGVFKVILRVTGAATTVDGSTDLPAQAAKLDVEITNFPYKGNGSSLALQASIVQALSSKVKNFKYAEDGGVTATNKLVSKVYQIGGDAIGDGQGVFAWADQIIADGSMVNVIASPPVDVNDGDDDSDKELGNNFKGKRMFFSFPTQNNAASLVWDPSVGAGTYDGSNSAAGFGVSSGLVALCAVVVAFMMR